jgi:hypothetical protein
MQLLLTTKRHVTTALRMPVRLSATTSASLNGCGGSCWDPSRCALNLMVDILSTYYKRTFLFVAHKLNDSCHVFMLMFLLFWYSKLGPKICQRLSVTPCILYWAYQTRTWRLHLLKNVGEWSKTEIKGSLLPPCWMTFSLNITSFSLCETMIILPGGN